VLLSGSYDCVDDSTDDAAAAADDDDDDDVQSVRLES